MLSQRGCVERKFVRELGKPERKTGHIEIAMERVVDCCYGSTFSQMRVVESLGDREHRSDRNIELL